MKATRESFTLSSKKIIINYDLMITIIMIRLPFAKNTGGIKKHDAITFNG